MQTFFKIVASVFRFLESLGRVLMVLLLVMFLATLIGASGHKAPAAPADQFALVIHPRGQLVEQLSASPLSLSELALSGNGPNETLIRDVVAVIKQAAEDKHVKCLVLDARDLDHSGLSKLNVLNDAIRQFKTSGKKVFAYTSVATQEQYYLLAQADQLMLDPLGEIELTGVASYHLYFHEALDRLGVDINVFKVGTHKSYPEPYTRQDMSKEDREQVKGLIEPLWADYRSGVEQARHLPAGTIASVVQQSVTRIQAHKGDIAQWALQEKLVDVLGTAADFEQRMIAEVGEDKSAHSFNAVDSDDYLQMRSALMPHPSSSKNVAVIVAAGEIVDGEAPAGQIGGDTLAHTLRQARFDDSVKAVVLRIDSGGGSMMASEAIRREVAALQEAHKPVVASMGAVAASGGYYIAMSADKIMAEPDTITGSIGVFAIVPTFQHSLQKVGVASDGVSTSPLAGMMNLERSLSPEAKAVLQVGVEHAYHQFVSLVAQNRHQAFAVIEPLAEGKVYLAPQAKQLGLVDEIGGVQAAITAAAKLANLETGAYGIDYREREPTWRELLTKALRDSRGEEAQAASATQLLNRWWNLKEVKQLRSLNDPKHWYATCACQAP